jgi:hypothetical protein
VRRSFSLAAGTRWVVTEVYRREQKGPRAWVAWYAPGCDSGGPAGNMVSGLEFGWTEQQARRRAERASRRLTRKAGRKRGALSVLGPAKPKVLGGRRASRAAGGMKFSQK